MKKKFVFLVLLCVLVGLLGCLGFNVFADRIELHLIENALKRQDSDTLERVVLTEDVLESRVNFEKESIKERSDAQKEALKEQRDSEIEAVEETSEIRLKKL